MSKTGIEARLPEPGEGKRGEDGHVGYLLRQAANVFRYKIEEALRDLDLTAPQFSALTMLAAYPGHSNADLARLAQLTPQTMNVIVANLSKAGLVHRRRHAFHGRIQHLELTDKGADILSVAKGRVYALEVGVSEGYSKQEMALVRRWLAGVVRW